jgi:hypothetical protein
MILQHPLILVVPYMVGTDDLGAKFVNLVARDVKLGAKFVKLVANLLNLEGDKFHNIDIILI